MVANDTVLNRLNRIFAKERIVEKGLRHLFITSSSSHFLNKTDFEQYRFTKTIQSLTNLISKLTTVKKPVLKPCDRQFRLRVSLQLKIVLL